MPVATRRASENARKRSGYYVEPTTERAVGTTPGMDDDCRDAGRLQGRRTTAGMQDDCRDAGRLQGCRTTAGMQELEQRRSGCRASATQERLPS